MIEEIFNNDTIREIMDEYSEGGQFAMQTALLRLRESSENKETTNKLTSLIKACAPYLASNERDWFFIPLFQYTPETRFNLSVFSEDELTFFDNFQQTVCIPQLNSQLLNILLETHPNYKYAQALLKNYDQFIFSPNDYYHSPQNIKRYISITLKYFKKDTNHINELREKLTNLIETHSSEHIPFSIEIAKLLKDFDLGCSKNRINISLSSAARQLNVAKDYFMAEKCAEAAFDWADNDEEKNNNLILRAQLKEMNADTSNPLFSIGYYQDAIKALQQIPNEVKDAHNIHQWVSRIQQKIEIARKRIPDNMQTIKTESSDITPIIMAYKNELKGESSSEQLKIFSNLFIFDLQDATKMAISHAKSPGISDFFDMMQFSEDGRKVATLKGIQIDEPIDEKHPRTLHTLRMNYMFHSVVCAYTISIILKEASAFNESDFSNYIEQIVEKNSFIEENHKPLFVTGLKFGYRNDFISALHLLAPQLEHLVRRILQLNKINTKTTDREGNENEIALGSLAKLSDFKRIFGERLSYEIQELFCIPTGPNIRNNIAHGLIGADSPSIQYFPYAWWLVINLLKFLNDEHQAS